ncbi:hypothetical protein CLU79DRAFT_714784 [Phycomyces nitens]|nr:hypothetical protein CLU79DRAFT_714784 [Phycomyces nitens]
MTCNAFTTASHIFRLALVFLFALTFVVVNDSTLACAFGTLQSTLARLFVDDMGMAYSHALFDNGQDSIKGNHGVRDEDSFKSQGALLEGKSSGVSLGERQRGIPGLEPFYWLILEAIYFGSTRIPIPSNMKELQEYFLRNWIRKSFMANDLEMFSEETCKQGNSAEENECHNVINEVGPVHNRVHITQMDESDEDGPSVEERETSDESMTIDDVNEYPVSETDIVMDELFELGSHLIADYVSVPNNDILMMKDLGMEAESHTVQQTGDFGEEVVSGVIPQSCELVGEPLYLGKRQSRALCLKLKFLRS